MTDHDTDRLDALRDASARLRGSVAATTSGDVDAVMARGRNRRRHSAVSAGIAGMLSIALTVSAVATIASARHGDNKKSPATAATSTPSITTTPKPIDEQLAASLGHGVPNGWVPVDLGKARLWVPPTAHTVSFAQCMGGPGTAGVQIVLIGTIAPGTCAVSADATYIVVGGATHTLPRPPKPIRTINGFVLYLRADSPTAISYDAPALNVTLTTHGESALINSVLGTLAPSAAAIAARTDLPIDTSRWRTVRYHSIEWRQPASWKVADRAGTFSGCSVEVPAATTSIGVSGVPARCPYGRPPDTVSTPVTAAEVADGTPLSNGAVALDGSVAKTLGATSITVHLGVDGRIGGAILRSAHEISSRPLTVDGCPATVPQTPHAPSGGASRLVPGTPTAVTVCRYHGFNVPSVTQGTLAGFAPGNAADLARTLNALTPVPPGPVANCPLDDGARVLVRFTDAHGGTFDVIISLGGCRYVTNGARNTYSGATLPTVLYDLVGGDCSFLTSQVICGPPQ